MHEINIPPHMIERVIGRRGKRHIFEDLDPARTVHLVVDLQNGFMDPTIPATISAARDVVPNVNKISAAIRKAGGLVIFIQATYDKAVGAVWSTYFGWFNHQQRRDKLNELFTAGHYGHDLWPEVDVQPGDLKVLKRRFSAMLPESSDLDAVLKKRGIDTMIITGAATNICCESTARDAMMMNYKVVFVADATATFTDQEHNAALGNMLLFTDVMTTDEVLAVLSRPRTNLVAAE
jgi:ureidoacrylate peracid hydrolase